VWWQNWIEEQDITLGTATVADIDDQLCKMVSSFTQEVLRVAHNECQPDESVRNEQLVRLLSKMSKREERTRTLVGEMVQNVMHKQRRLLGDVDIGYRRCVEMDVEADISFEVSNRCAIKMTNPLLRFGKRKLSIPTSPVPVATGSAATTAAISASSLVVAEEDDDDEDDDASGYDTEEEDNNARIDMLGTDTEEELSSSDDHDDHDTASSDTTSDEDEDDDSEKNDSGDTTTTEDDDDFDSTSGSGDSNNSDQDQSDGGDV
jgi:hypothetical protein